MCGNLHACILYDTAGVAISQFVAICRPHIFFSCKGGYSSICSNINSHLLSFTCGHFSVCGNLHSPTFLLLWFYSLTFLQGLPFLSLWQSAFSLFNLQGWLFFRFGQSGVPPLLLQGWLFLICSKMQWQYAHFYSCRSDYFTIYSMYHFSCRGGYFLVCDNLHLHLGTIASTISEEVQTFYGHHYHKSPPLYF